MLKQKTIEKKKTLTIPSTQALQKKDYGSSFITQQHSGGVLKPQPSEEPKNYKAQKPDSQDSKKISVEVIPESLQNSQTSLAMKVRDDQSEIKEEVIKEENGLEDALDVQTENGSADGRQSTFKNQPKVQSARKQTRNQTRQEIASAVVSETESNTTGLQPSLSMPLIQAQIMDVNDPSAMLIEEKI